MRKTRAREGEGRREGGGWTYLSVLVSFECRLFQLDGVDAKNTSEDNVVQQKVGEDEEDHEQGDVPDVQIVVGLEGGRGEGGREGGREAKSVRR